MSWIPPSFGASITIEGEESRERSKVDPVAKCGRCRNLLDPTDKSFDGRARFQESPFCRGCVDRCHDSEIAEHTCLVCTSNYWNRKGGAA